MARAQELGMLCGAIMTTEDLVNDPHYRGRGAWDTIDHPFTGPVEYPGRPFIMSASPRPQPRRAPLLGEHNVEVYVEQPGLDRNATAALRAQGVAWGNDEDDPRDSEARAGGPPRRRHRRRVGGPPRHAAAGGGGGGDHPR